MARDSICFQGYNYKYLAIAIRRRVGDCGNFEGVCLRRGLAEESPHGSEFVAVFLLGEISD